MSDDTSYITHTSDVAVMGTADDALTAKLATVNAGYYSDPYLPYFAASIASSSSTTHHPQYQQEKHQSRTIQPIIKRGTHARVACIDRAIEQFVKLHAASTSSSSSSTIAQIVVLGAGMDTSFLRQGDNYDIVDPQQRWFEIDLPSVMRRKRRLLERHLQKWNLTLLPQPQKDTDDDDDEDSAFTILQQQTLTTTSTETIQRRCTCLSHDLRLPPSTLLQTLTQHGFSVSEPVLFVSECVQMYLPEETSRVLWRELTTACLRASLVLYDPILLASSDAFGRVMEQHLSRAGVMAPTSSMSQTRTLRQQLDKLVQYGGFHLAVGCDMWQAYHTVVTRDQQLQANQAEFLDELEEWTLLMQHYCLVVASNNEEEGLCQVGRGSPMGFSEKQCLVVRKS